MENKLTRIAELLDAKYVEAQEKQVGAVRTHKDAVEELKKSDDSMSRMKIETCMNVIVCKAAEMAVYKELAAILRQVNEEQ